VIDWQARATSACPYHANLQRARGFRSGNFAPLSITEQLRAAGFARSTVTLLQDRGDVLSESAKRVGVEPVRFTLGGAKEITNGSSTETIEKP
jgi:hypothetical protein